MNIVEARMSGDRPSRLFDKVWTTEVEAHSGLNVARMLAVNIRQNTVMKIGFVSPEITAAVAGLVAETFEADTVKISQLGVDSVLKPACDELGGDKAGIGWGQMVKILEKESIGRCQVRYKGDAPTLIFLVRKFVGVVRARLSAWRYDDAYSWTLLHVSPQDRTCWSAGHCFVSAILEPDSS